MFDKYRLLLIFFTRSIKRDIYIKINIRNRVKITNVNLFITELPCNTSDVIFLMTSKNNGVNDNFFNQRSHLIIEFSSQEKHKNQ